MNKYNRIKTEQILKGISEDNLRPCLSVVYCKRLVKKAILKELNKGNDERRF